MSNELSPLKQEIISDVEERKRLMLQIKTLSLRYGFNEKDEQLFLSYSIPIIYSLWEGFIQNSFRTYIQELNKLDLKVDDIYKKLLIYHMESNFKQFREYPKNDQRKLSFFDNLHIFYKSESIQINPVVNTESNVGFDVLNRILRDFNLESIPEYPKPRFSLKEELDKFFLKIRNTVAHGQDSIKISREDLVRAIELVELLMDMVLDRLTNGFQRKTYLNI